MVLGNVRDQIAELVYVDYFALDAGQGYLWRRDLQGLHCEGLLAELAQSCA